MIGRLSCRSALMLVNTVRYASLADSTWAFSASAWVVAGLIGGEAPGAL